MHRVLFVDDELNVLEGLERGLRDMRRQWQMHFVRTAVDALQLLAATPFDVIVSDMRMPGMDGAELLSEVRRRFPGVIRIILSGYPKEVSVMRTVDAAHQYLAKPCEPETLIEVVTRALKLRQAFVSEHLIDLLGGQRNLPTPSDTYFRLVEYMDSPNASTNGAAEIVKSDVGMTAELLRLTNSAYFSLPAQLNSPLQAVKMLGFDTLRSLVLRIGIFRNFKGLSSMTRIIEGINRDSFLVARIARRIAKSERLDQRVCEEAFCAGMLCSIGTLVMLDRVADRFPAARAKVAAGSDPITAECEIFGASHLTVGAYLLALWGFKDAVVEAVACAGRPSECQCTGVTLPLIVHAARAAAGPHPAYFDATDPKRGSIPLERDYFERQGLGGRLAAWLAEAEAELAQ